MVSLRFACRLPERQERPGGCLPFDDGLRKVAQGTVPYLGSGALPVATTFVALAVYLQNLDNVDVDVLVVDEAIQQCGLVGARAENRGALG